MYVMYTQGTASSASHKSSTAAAGAAATSSSSKGTASQNGEQGNSKASETDGNGSDDDDAAADVPVRVIKPKETCEYCQKSFERLTDFFKKVMDPEEHEHPDGGK